MKLYLFFSYRRLLPLLFSDTDPYFSLPKYKVLIPDCTEVDASVIDFYFTDSDYADFYDDYNPEYDNDPYFYLDTTKGKYKYKYQLTTHTSTWLTQKVNTDISIN